MNRVEFLNEEKGFVEWLVGKLPALEITLKIANSRFVPGGVEATCRGMEEVLTNYRWQALDGDEVVSCDWPSTRDYLSKLAGHLRDSVDNGNEDSAENACLKVLRWGGVLRDKRGAKPFILGQTIAGTLVRYLKATRDLLRLDAEQSLEDVTADRVIKFDSGMTKIHALLDESGLPIYDSRVGAAISMLEALYRMELGDVRSSPHFASGRARGAQVRNPGKLGFDNAPIVFGLRPNIWAQNQLKLGWVISAVIDGSNLFRNEGGVPARCHALEASLFMMGYDLKCFGIPKPDGKSSDSNPTTPRYPRSDKFMWNPEDITITVPRKGR
jgi:hypothetical protein